MKFISRERSPGFILKHADVQVIATNQGNLVNRKPAARIKFKALRAPFKTAALPVVNYKDSASGILDSKLAADRLRQKGHVFKDGDEDVTEKVVIDFLFNHEKYGKDFIAVGEDGQEITETVVIPEGDGGWFCRLCGQHFENSQGKDGHVTSSKKHKENLDKANAEAIGFITP